ncbi:MAG: tetratricopeptide repeat protein [Chloroflexi bacterium]|nr:tetratricopeptide repeat protein [Chloroflexota bacterium]
MMTKQVKLLGTLTINENGRTSPLAKNAKGCALLTYLVVTEQPQSREAIADLLWDAHSTKQSLRNLRVLLTRIRPYLPELEISRSTLALQPNHKLDIDLLILSNALKSDNPVIIDQALAAYKGDLLTGFHLEDAPQFNEWLLLTRERFRRQVRMAYDQVCAAYFEQQKWGAGIDAARRWLLLDDLNEHAYRWLMRHLVGNKQIAQAMQQYEICCQRLEQELGIDPDQTTISLAQQLSPKLSATEDLFLLETASSMPWPQANELAEVGPLPSTTYLPHHRNNDFTGRRGTLLQLATWLQPCSESDNDRGNVVAITGMGGLGKTQIAVEFCYRYGRYYSGGVYWISFADATTVAEEVAHIGGERGMGLYRDAEKLTLADQVGRVQKAWQNSSPRLLVFDNCEDEALLTKWMPVTGGCHVLLTSQRGLWSRELGVITHPLQLFNTEEATALLRHLDSSLSTTDAAQIGKALGYLPLALHLAGGFLHRYTQISPTQYLQQLQDKGLLQHPSMQGRGINLSPTGHELHVVRTFNLSLAQLKPEDDEVDYVAQQLLIRSARFAPGEPIPQQILQETTRPILVDEDGIMATLLLEDGIARLISLGILERKSKEHVVIHRLLSAFTLKFLAADDAQTAVENHTIHLLKTIWQENVYIYRLPLPAVHVQHITKNALVRADANAVHLANLWGRHLMDIGEQTGALSYFEQALSLQEKIFSANDPETAVTLNSLGTLQWQMGDLEHAWAYYERALHIYEHTSGVDHPDTARILNNLAILFRLRGDCESSRTYFERALTIFRQQASPDQVKIVTVIRNLGITCNQMGDYAAAVTYNNEAMCMQVVIFGDEHPVIADNLNGLGVSAYFVGDYDVALDYFKRAYAIRKKTLGDNHLHSTNVIANLGIIYTRQGEFEEALAWQEKALTIRENKYGRSSPYTARSLSLIGHIYLLTGNLETAQKYLEEALSYQEFSQRDVWHKADTLTYLGDCYLQQGKVDKVKQHLIRALEIRQASQGEAHILMAQTLISFGEYQLAMENEAEAIAYFEQAFTILKAVVKPTQVDLVRVQKHLV